MNRTIVAVCGLVAGGGLGVAGCVGTAAEPPAEEPSEEPADVVEARALIMREYVGEARGAVGTPKGEACRAYCALSYATACWRVTQVCAGAEVATIGGATIPCATAMGAVCLSSVALASICQGQCPA